MSTKKSLELKTLENFGIYASVDLKKSVNANIKSIIDASSAKDDRQVIIQNAISKQKSISEVLKYLNAELISEAGTKMLNSNLLTIDFFNVHNTLKSFSGFFDANNKKTVFSIIKKTDDNDFFNTTLVNGFKLSLSVIDDGFLSKIDDNGFLILIDKNQITYTIKIIESFTFPMVLNRLAKFKKVLLCKKIQAIKNANIEKAEALKIAEKAEKAEAKKAEKEKAEAEAKAKAEAEALIISEKLKKLEMYEKAEAEAKAKAEKNTAAKLKNVA
jgi:hypothetical protein